MTSATPPIYDGSNVCSSELSIWAIAPTPASAPGAASLTTCRIVAEAQRLLAASPYFRRRANTFEFEVADAVLIVRGRVPSFHLKQMLQKVLANLHGVARIDNRVHVVSSAGLSSAG